MLSRDEIVYSTWKNCSPGDFGEKPRIRIHVSRVRRKCGCHKESTLEDLERFVCCMYGKPKYTSINKLRYDLFMQSLNPSQQVSCCLVVMEYTVAFYRQVKIHYKCISSGQIIKLLYGIIQIFAFQISQVQFVMGGCWTKIVA